MVCKPCAVPKCDSKDGIRFRFPHPINAKQRFEKWLEILKNPLLYSLDHMVVYSMKRICTRHFSKDCFVKPNKIKYSSVPTLYVPDPEAAKSWNYSNTTDYINRNTCNYNRKRFHHKAESCNQSIACEVMCTEDPVDEIPVKTFDQRCRICLEVKENRLPLDYKTNIYKEECLTLMEIIHNFCNVEIALNDDKPQMICVECAEKLRAMYEITICCEKNDFILNKESLKKSKNNVIKTKRVKVISEYSINEMLDNNRPKINVIEESNELPMQKPVNIWPKPKRVKVISKCAWCEINQFNRLCLKESDGKRNTVVCLECHQYFKRQHRNKLIDGVFIRKKRYVCSCGARFGNSVKLVMHAMNH